MLLVNDPGSWSHIYPPLRHAAWHGWTPTDLVFPFFLFIVGVTTHLSLTARRAGGANDGELARHIIRRALIIVLLGLLLAAFPFVPPSRLVTLRIPGVLQRIGIVYLVAGLLVLKTTPRTQAWIAGLILIGYWLLLAFVPVPGVGPATLAPPDATLAAWLDRLLLDGHLWAETKTWDPEGPLSTIPAIATCLLGVLAGRWITQPRPLADRLNGLFAAGAIALALGAGWSWLFPINKNLWTSSYVVFTAGMAAIALATCMWLVEERRTTWWTKPFVVFGRNPIIAFVGAEAMARLIYSVITVPWNGGRAPVQVAVYQRLFASWLPPEPASLAFAVVFVVLWYGILWLLDRRGIRLKI